MLTTAEFQEGIVNFPRRRFLHLAAGAAALPLIPGTARAQAYPSRMLRWVVPFAAGGAIDLTARLLALGLSARVGQPVIIENRPGAVGNLGTEAVVKAAPDGYTLLHIATPTAINAALYGDKLRFDIVRDIAGVALLHQTPAVVIVNTSLPVHTVPQLIEFARANPGKLNMGAGGPAGVQTVYGELFKMMAGIDMFAVHYHAAVPAFADLMAGQLHVVFEPVTTAIGLIRAGKVRPIAVTSAKRLDVLADVPAAAEFVPGYEAVGLMGLGVPRSTPGEIIKKLNTEINMVLSDPKLKTQIEELGGVVETGSPGDFEKLVFEEIEKWRRVVKFAGLKPE
jgi:tripartite-type tricarboxylate transporter receptor subunit TctC